MVTTLVSMLCGSCTTVNQSLVGLAVFAPRFFAVPVLVMIGRESLPQGLADDELLFEFQFDTNLNAAPDQKIKVRFSRKRTRPYSRS